MEMFARVSRGSVMDQVYLPKRRHSFPVGSYVVIKPLLSSESEKSELFKPVFYGVKSVEPVKLRIVEDIFSYISRTVDSYDNIIITGSFLERGFHFNDFDVLLVSEKKIDTDILQKGIEDRLGIKSHVLVLDTGSLLQGLSTDPLYQSMLSSCIAKKKFLYKAKKRVLYKLLDLHLLKSDLIFENFDVLTGDEKYDLTRNMIAIRLFLKYDFVRKEMVEEEIRKLFHIESVQELRDNIVQKGDFLKVYKKLYKETFNKIMDGVRNESKQKQAS